MDIQKLIEEVHIRPFFYDKKNKQFRDLVFKENEWLFIANKLNTDGNNITI